MQALERTILRQLFHSVEYAEQVVPYLKSEYFYTAEAASIYKLFVAFFEKFHVIPQFAAIRIGLDVVKSLSEQQIKDAQVALKSVEGEAPLDDTQKTWLLEQTEEFCQDRAVYRAIQKAIEVMDDPSKTRHVIPDMLKEALAVSFDQHVGHRFFDNAEARYDFYHMPEARLPFDVEVFNAMTKGGVPKKTLNVAVAGTNVGKSLVLVHFAGGYLKQNKNVLYITCEMAEERIAERVDANLMNVPLDDLIMLPKKDYLRKIAHLKQVCKGELVIKEYPTGTAHVGHIRTLLQELRLKQNFVPDVIVVDYLTICASSRTKMGNSVNTNTYYKAVAEELRGLAVEMGVPLWTAAQFNRIGHASTDPGIENIGEAFAIAQTADFMFALVTSEELDKVGQLGVLELKNRYGKKKAFSQQLIGVDTDRMKVYDLTAAQLAAAANLPAASLPAQTSSKPSVSTFSRNRRQPLTSLKKENAPDDD